MTAVTSEAVMVTTVGEIIKTVCDCSMNTAVTAAGELNQRNVAKPHLSVTRLGTGGFSIILTDGIDMSTTLALGRD